MASSQVAQNQTDTSFNKVDARAGQRDKVDLTTVENVDIVDDGMVKGELDLEGHRQGKADYSGFAQKTDRDEIKLVRKMDIRIMLSLWSMYWLNYL